MAARWRDLIRRRPLVLGVLGVMAAIAGGVAARMRRAVACDAGWISGSVDGMPYAVLLPAQYDPHRRYPVVLYLHQLAMGNWRDALLRQVDPWFNAAAFRVRHPCIVVVPMLDQTGDPDGLVVNFGGKPDGGAGEDTSIAAVHQVMQRYSADTDRIYVTGNSMGGIGTWAMVLDYNRYTGGKGRIFAAALPLAGSHRTADPDEAARALRDVPIWAIHGAKDRTVELGWDRRMAELLHGRPNFRYTEDPALGHDIWDSYYVRPQVWDWLFAQLGDAAVTQEHLAVRGGMAR